MEQTAEYDNESESPMADDNRNIEAKIDELFDLADERVMSLRYLTPDQQGKARRDLMRLRNSSKQGLVSLLTDLHEKNDSQSDHKDPPESATLESTTLFDTPAQRRIKRGRLAKQIRAVQHGIAELTETILRHRKAPHSSSEFADRLGGSRHQPKTAKQDEGEVTLIEGGSADFARRIVGSR